MKRPLLSSIAIAIVLFAAAFLWRPQGVRVMPIKNITPPAALRTAQQMILVRTPDWGSVSGTMQRYARSAAHEPWTAVGASTSIVVGRSGLGWGRGVNGAAPAPGPTKREGDARAPAGVFLLRSAFGYANPEHAAFVKLPYTQSTSAVECVDDVDSTHYNRLIDRSKTTTVDWKSSEQMLRPDEQYRWGIVVDHNANSPVPGGGSCIFMHIWSAPSAGTSGCTAMDAGAIDELLRWVDPAAHPVLVQLPQAEFNLLKQPWGLPESGEK